MHLKKHLIFIFAIVCVLGAIYFYALSDMFHPKQIASYENFTEMSEEFDATQEIAAAENVSQSCATESVLSAIRKLRKIFKKNNWTRPKEG